MAMFLSRLKQILNLGTKSITANGTYSASGDGYDGYSQVSVNMPSVTPSNSTPAVLTSGNAVTPNANGYAIASYEEIDAPSASYTYTIRPDMPTISRVGALEGVEQLHFHSLSPSNSNPAIISDGEIYRAGNAGKAVASVTDVIPSSTPTSVSTDDVVHIQGSGVIVDNVPPTPTSLTPSNSSPAQMTANTPVNPTANGYAIESYHSIGPRNYHSDSMTAGEVYIPTNNGVAVESVTVLTPSNSNPPFLGGASYQFADIGYAIESYEEITPKNSNPPTLLLDHIYKIKTRNGIAIGAVNTVVPSDDDPPLLSVGSYNFVNGAPGYLYKTKQKIKTGTVTLSTSATTYVNIGFKPKYIGLIVYKDDTHFTISVYNENVSDSYTYRGTKNGSTVTCASFALPTSSSTSNTSKILSIDSTGFTIDKASSTFGTTAKYFAIGEEPTGTLPPMNVTVHHGSSSVSNYSIVDNIGYTKLKLVSSTATTSSGNQYAIDNGSYVSVSVGSTVSIPSTGQVKLYLNRTGENTAVWEFTN